MAHGIKERWYRGVVCILAAISFVSSSSAQSILRSELARSFHESGHQFHFSGIAETVQTSIIVDGERLSVELTPVEIRSPGYKAEETQGDTRHPVPVNVYLFRGTGDSLLRGAYFPALQSFSGLLLHKGRYLQLSGDSDSSALDSSLYQAEGGELSCGALGLPSKLPLVDSITPYFNGSFSEVEVATDASYTYVTGRGGSSNANAEILSIFNIIDGIYRRDLGVRLRISYQHTWGSPDPYPTNSGGALIDSMRTYWEANFRPFQQYDVAHLLYGSDLPDFAGIAVQVGGICGPLAYSLSTHANPAYQNTLLVAHEVGHTLGAAHDALPCGGMWTMCPGGGGGLGSAFSPVSFRSVSSALQRTSCTDQVEGMDPILDPIGPLTIAEGDTLNHTVRAVDPDNGRMSYTVYDGPEGMRMVENTLVYRPPHDLAPPGGTRTYYVIVLARDSTGGTDSEVVPVTVTDRPGPALSLSVRKDSVRYVMSGTNSCSTVQLFVSPNKEELLYNAGGTGLGVKNTSGGRAAFKSIKMPKLSGSKSNLYVAFACNGERYPDVDLLAGSRIRGVTTTRSTKKFIALLKKNLRRD